MFAKISSIGLFGLNAFPVTAEISASQGVPAVDIVGLADQSVQESRMRIKSAIENSGMKMGSIKCVINLSPAGVKKSGSGYDLAILTALLTAAGYIPKELGGKAFIGEVSLGGEICPINGALAMAVEAAESGISELYLPADNAAEASVVKNIRVYGVKNVRELAAHLCGRALIKPAEPLEITEEFYKTALDFADVKGQEAVKSAIEVAAAGFHNMLMIGPPGTGKSMIAKRIPTVLPRMSFEESIETTKIHSVAGILSPTSPLVTRRPFRDVSHTASSVGLIGGGSVPKPGEISLAHNGVLFLDEFPEFDRRVLETLRQPLENGEITISRAAGAVTYPCNIMLVAAMNPCPCGNYGSPLKKCTCTQQQVARYLGKISQPILDRIDIQTEVSSVRYEDLAGNVRSECSAAMAERIAKAREIQTKRFRGTAIKSNSGITPDLLHQICVLDEKAGDYLKLAFEKTGLSARAYDRVLKVARTCADLDGADVIGKPHIARAISYRSLDRKYWGGGMSLS
ncbi:MAG: YifB family Mg chelatase-like AAA ATPase [Ruminiclostridium sp.]|nr:YifB family Mg chelatase-like AAA ATPase [Ruminiclostridium sp.]